MRLDTLERFVNKDQDLWDREDIEKLMKKYGKHAIFYNTEGITNRLFMLFKYRHMSEYDDTILDFMAFKNREYGYIIEYINNYTKSIDFIFWPSETALQVVYKILCERVLNDEKITDDSKEYKKLKWLAKNISLYRYAWNEKMKKITEEL